MRCDDVQPLLTAYLDGDLDASDGSAVRGHLRECATCREVAAEEAALRDGLRAMPSVDPPSSLWNGIRAQLAEAEVRDANRPAWRRAMTRWQPELRQVAPVMAVLAVAACVMLAWRMRGEPIKVDVAMPAPPAPPVQKTIKMPPAPPPVDDFQGDVTADLARDGARRNNAYQASVDRLLAEVQRTSWTADQKHELDEHLRAFEQSVLAALPGHARDKELRKEIRYLENALAREEVAIR